MMKIHSRKSAKYRDHVMTVGVVTFHIAGPYDDDKMTVEVVINLPEKLDHSNTQMVVDLHRELQRRITVP